MNTAQSGAKHSFVAWSRLWFVGGVSSGRLPAMAPKKQTKSKRRAGSKIKSTKQSRKKKPTAKRQPSAPSAHARKNKKRSVAQAKTARKKTVARIASAPKKSVRSESADPAEFTVRTPGRVLSGRQSGDLQGLSGSEGADSESVTELLEEGNPFEAGVVAGVEDADVSDERGVHTRELAEDDVPQEYLDKEQ